ncbi:MAG: hydrogenase iron-sulfur subunit [Proteobacteria bacterium]|nr:hydrogenase iron-sulfur subunit [Pseudomonadota bacterium]
MGDCHYLDGNVKAEKTFGMTKKFLGLLGIDPARVQLVWISSAEGSKFAQVANAFTKEIKELGPAGIKQVA